MRINKLNNGNLSFYCEGCDRQHEVNHLWDFNGDYEAPTLTPSVLVSGTVPTTEEEVERIMNGEKIAPKELVCHSFVENGKIRFLNDCTHNLSGETIELRILD